MKRVVENKLNENLIHFSIFFIIRFMICALIGHFKKTQFRHSLITAFIRERVGTICWNDCLVDKQVSIDCKTAANLYVWIAIASNEDSMRAFVLKEKRSSLSFNELPYYVGKMSNTISTSVYR